MIDIKELRINNIVTVDVSNPEKDGKIYLVKQIRTLVQLMMPTSRMDYFGYFRINDLRPIELTEEILLKCGFEKTEYRKGHIGIDYKRGDITFDFVLEEPEFMGEWDKYYTFELPDHRFVNVKHLHQLQNLFFDLTGNELEFNNTEI